MAEKFKMVSETCIFEILLSKLQFSTDFKNLDCIRSVFLLSNFLDFCSFKVKNGEFFEDFVNLRINRKLHVATEIGSTFFGCWSGTG
jgi:hypothetical protein